jgi:hypothetical protein
VPTTRPPSHFVVTLHTDPTTGDEHLTAGGVLDYPDAHAALMAWCRGVGIDPEKILAEDPIVITADRREITVHELVRDHEDRLVRGPDGRPHTSARYIGLERPAPPWPVELVALTQAAICPACGQPKDPGPADGLYAATTTEETR